MTNAELITLPVDSKVKVKPWEEIKSILSQLDWVDEKQAYCGRELTISMRCPTHDIYGARVHAKEDKKSYYWYASMLDFPTVQIVTADEFKKIMQ